MERGTGGMSCGEKVNWQRSGWQKEGVGGVVIGIKYKSTGTKVNWRCMLFWVGWAGIGRRGQRDAAFSPRKVPVNGSPRKLDWHLIVAKGAVVMGLGAVDSGHVVQSLGDRLGRWFGPVCRLGRGRRHRRRVGGSAGPVSRSLGGTISGWIRCGGWR